MRTKIFNILKISALAVVLSLGITYVYAWVGPTATPPGNNTSAPINTSATSQTKAGSLTLQGNLTTNVANANFFYSPVTMKWLGYESLSNMRVSQTAPSLGSPSMTVSCPTGTVITSCSAMGTRMGGTGPAYNQQMGSLLDTNINSCSATASNSGGVGITSMDINCIGVQ